jgi:hypothetical protein
MGSKNSCCPALPLSITNKAIVPLTIFLGSSATVPIFNNSNLELRFL